MLACALGVGLASASGASAANLFSKLPGELFQGRYTPAAALLPDGKVLIAGGFGKSGAIATAEIYDPASGSFEQLTAEETQPHGEQATVALPDGHVLIVGGWSSATKSLKSAELFDPATRTFAKVTAEMAIERDGPGAVLLPSGKVFITGGAQNAGEYTKTAELYDPATRTFSAVKGLAFSGRYQPAAVLLPDGKVLVAGGHNGSPANEYTNTAEIFDPATETFEKLEGPGHELTERRSEEAAVTLQNGRVLIAGGFNNSGKDLASAEVFDYATRTFSSIPDTLTTPRDGGAAVLLPDGRALFVAGYDEALGENAYQKSIDITSVPAATPSTGAASGVGMTTATIAGSVQTEARATVYFQLGTSTAYGSTIASRQIGYAPTPQGLAASLSALKPGTTYHFRVVAENAGGTSYGADQSFATAPPVPTFASVKQTHARWREGNSLAQASRARAPLGTAFSFTLNTPATVTFAFTQKVAGRRVHGKCVAPSHRNHRARRCSRTVTRGTLAISGHAGVNTLKFQGRVSSRNKLRPGTYTLVITAAGPSGAAAPQRLTFTIVR
jgi:hypothetical protein